MIGASGIGSWPEIDARRTIRQVRDLLADEVGAIPYLPELPSRGPGADLIGRAGALLVDLPIELHPSGWQLAGRPGRDVHRAIGWERADLDELAEAYDGYEGPLKVQVPGPWTLAASIELPRGERVVSDAGARRDLIASLSEGVKRYAGEVGRLLPQTDVIVQVDEPSVGAVLRGELPTVSGLGRVRAVDQTEIVAGLRDLALSYAGRTVIHSCDRNVPVSLIASAGFDGLAIDLTDASPQRWEDAAGAVENGIQLWAGVVPTHRWSGGAVEHNGAEDTRRIADQVAAETAKAMRGIGLDRSAYDDVVITPTCGVSGLSNVEGVLAHRVSLEAARRLDETG